MTISAWDRPVNYDQQKAKLQKLIEEVPASARDLNEYRRAKLNSELIVVEIFGEETRELYSLNDAWNAVAATDSIEARGTIDLGAVHVALEALQAAIERRANAVPDVRLSTQQGSPLSLPEHVTLEWIRRYVPAPFLWGLLGDAASLFMGGVYVGFQVGVTEFGRQLAGRETPSRVTAPAETKVERARVPPPVATQAPAPPT
jgi:hypothetical protein